MTIPFWTAFFSLGLLALAGSILVRTFSAPRLADTTIYVRPHGTPLASLLWALPVFAVFGWVVLKAAPSFEYPVQERAEVPEGLDIRLEESTGLSVDASAETPRGNTDTDGPKLPEWVGKPPQKDGDKLLISLSTKEQPTQADAEKELLALAAAKVRSDFDGEFPSKVEWALPPSAIRFNLAHEEKIPRKAGNVSFTMTRLHRQLEISPETRQAAFAAWRKAIVAERLRGMAGVGGLLALIVFAIAAYLRLDARTLGQCRGRLKTAALASILAGGLIAAAIV